MKKTQKVRGTTFSQFLLLTLLALFSLLHTRALAQLPMALGDLDADRVPTVIDLQLLLNHINAATNAASPGPLPVSILPYADINEDGLVNTNDVLLLQDAILGRSTLPNPYAVPVVNISSAATNGDIVTITGTARPNRRIMITGGQFVVFANSGTNGQFTAQVRLRRNQVNALFVTATNATFTAGIPQPLRVLQDSQSPNLFIDFPTNGTTLHSESTVIAGRVGDSLSGFAGLNVRVRSVESQVEFPAVVDVGIGNNGTYERSNVPLVEGTNTIRVTATDIHGNVTNREITIIRRPLEGPRLLALFGDGQKTNVHRRLSDPIVVKATQADGITPLANTLVTFEVTRSDGRLQPLSPATLADPAAFTNDINRTPFGVPRVTLRTDAAGTARVWWALGGDAGCGNNRVCVMNAGISNAVYFCASADAAPPKQINIGTGNNQKAETGGFLPEPLRAWVNDSCNGNEGQPVTFTVVQGNGRLSPVGTRSTASVINNGNGVEPVPTTEGVSTLTVPTTRTGHAEVLFQTGPDAGQNIIEANYPGNTNLPATFIAYGVARDASKPTTLTGLLLDNTSQPIGGATMRLSVGGRSFTNTTDIQGRFNFGQPGTTNSEPETLPSGPATLTVNGSTATNLLGVAIPTNSYPSLEFQLILIPNAENSLPSPVLLPKLNLANQRLYYGTNDLVLTCEGMEGLKMTIKAGSMKKPDGTLVTPSNPSFVSLNQVHHDNVPMPIPDGASPPFAWTLQPGGATFDPPVQVEYPNMSGLPAGTIAYFLSYNHDTRRFEIICSGHVREDSATIVTDPGAGLTIAGWGCNCPPYSVTGECEPCRRSAPPLRSAQDENEFRFDYYHGPPSRKPTPAGVLAYTHVKIESDFSCVNTATPEECEAGVRRFMLRARVIARTTDKVVNVFITDTDDYNDEVAHETEHENIYQRGIEVQMRDSLKELLEREHPSHDLCNQAKSEAEKITREVWKRIICEHKNHDNNFAERMKANRLACKYRLVDPIKNCSFCLAFFDVAPDCHANAGGPPPPSITADCESPAPLGRFSIEEPVVEEFGVRLLLYELERIDAKLILVTGSQGIDLDANDYFKISNISAPDEFGPGGPGDLPPDFVSDDYVRVTGVSTQGGTNRYAISEFFQIRQGQTTFINDLTFTDIPPRKPESLTIICTNHILRIGEPRPLEVLARFADGTTTNVAPKTSWTSYRISNPNIATISPDGLVTPLKPGVIYITAVNEGATAVCGLNVVAGDDGLTTVTGTVVDTNGVPIAGAVVRIRDLAIDPMTTGPDGRFSISNVPTTLGPLGISIWVTLNGQTLTAFVRVTGQPGTTTLGNVVAALFGGSDLPRFASGRSHTVALRDDGSLWAWGGNEHGQLGNGTTGIFTSTNIPQPIEANSAWRAVAAGTAHSVAIREDGSMWAWGANGSGQLGNGAFGDASTPQLLAADARWVGVAAGGGHTVALRADGTLWAWGRNDSGQLGNGTTVWTNTPQQVRTSDTWRSVSAGSSHTVALREDGTVWAWGRNDRGQLGNGTFFNASTPQQILTNFTCRAISAGTDYTVAVREDGTLWAWGNNSNGQLGDGTFDHASTPQPVQTNITWSAVSAGYIHTVALRADGTLWAWGNDEWLGLLGTGVFEHANTPQPVELNQTWRAVSSGQDHTVALAEDGTLWAWGDNRWGQLGNSALSNVNTPQPIQTNVAWRAVAAGGQHSLALREDGTLWAWGWNSLGQLGNGTYTSASSPQPVQTNATWGEIGAGYYHAVAIREDGKLWAWGMNDYGELGDGTVVGANTPQPVVSNLRWQALSTAEHRTTAVAEDGTLWAWGWNFAGQLGTGTLVDADTPQPVQTNVTWRAVAAGYSHTVALRQDGTLWAWGNNFFGQLGNGTYEDANTPQPVQTNFTWRAVAAGHEHTVALREDGTLWAWGYNAMGQLGDATFFDAGTPQPVQTNFKWRAVAAGPEHTVALRDDGTLWTWGSNQSGQLGNGTSFESLNTPTPIMTNITWQAVAAGYAHTLAVRSDGTLWSWGDNRFGQIAQPVSWLPNPVLGGAVWGPPRP